MHSGSQPASAFAKESYMTLEHTMSHTGEAVIATLMKFVISSIGI
jgi:hypothetical protein